MKSKILDHYLEFGTYTFPGKYLENLQNDLPNHVKEIGLLIRKNFIHRVTLFNGNKWSNADLRYGDMTKVPWYRQAEDDVLVTVAAMLAELYRRDPRGFVQDRAEKDKVILTCRFDSLMMASILKAKGIPARVRSGFENYTESGDNPQAVDHWITQYYNVNQERWITIDVDCCMEPLKFDPFDLPDNTYIFSPDAWLDVREGRLDGKNFWNAGGFDGLVVIAWELFYDFHSLMNSEISYLHHPSFVTKANFDKITEKQLKSIDELARLMQDPDKNFDKLKEIWETNKEFRLLKGALL